ncbi:TPA: hypothetical protein N0F65_007610 [Lagenidium giganteum]|uniref:Uncharacterized protein n=1 Tax=Lagenidium giganteum TaxID=4803 RepID=A0AAV2ZNV6_9STRA|nr:TPA: hypothetical protein N0F65_007610 [Lagenidium giganteum]
MVNDQGRLSVGSSTANACGLAAILRDIDISVVRVEAISGNRPGVYISSPEYVFAVTPLKRSHGGAFGHSGRRSSIASTTATRSTIASQSRSSAALEASHAALVAGAVHEVRRTYSACRRLYFDLLKFTNCTHRETCVCNLGSCPFWTMFLILQAFEFPRKRLRFWQRYSPHVFHERSRSLNLFMKCILHKLQVYRDDFFAGAQSVFGMPHRRPQCKVLQCLEDFLELREDVVSKLREVDDRMHMKLNLRGWQSDWKNLYFASEQRQATGEGGTGEGGTGEGGSARSDTSYCDGGGHVTASQATTAASEYE